MTTLRREYSWWERILNWFRYKAWDVRFWFTCAFRSLADNGYLADRGIRVERVLIGTYQFESIPLLRWSDMKHRRFDVISRSILRASYEGFRQALRHLNALRAEAAMLGAAAMVARDLDDREPDVAAMVLEAEQALAIAHVLVARAERTYSDRREPLPDIGEEFEAIGLRIREGLMVPAHMLGDAMGDSAKAFRLLAEAARGFGSALTV